MEKGLGARERKEVDREKGEGRKRLPHVLITISEKYSLPPLFSLWLLGIIEELLFIKDLSQAWHFAKCLENKS